VPQIVKNGQFLVDFSPNAHLLIKFNVFHDFDNVNINLKRGEISNNIFFFKIKKEYSKITLPLGRQRS